MAKQPNAYKKFVATAATATLVASALAPVASAATVDNYKDVSKDYKVAVNYLLENGIAQGTSDTTFGTSSNISRGDAAVMIAKALKLDTTNAKDAGFQDVNSRVEGAVNAIVEAGIASGRTTAKFDPAAYITRQEMAKMLTNAYNLTATEKAGFKDVNKNWIDYVSALKENGITLGKSETVFAPTANLTRGEFALFVYRAEVKPANDVVVVEKVEVKDATTTLVTVKTANKELKAEDFKVLVNGEAVTPTKVVSDEKGEVYTIGHADLTGKKGTVSVNGKQTSFNFEVVEAKVESVKAINAKQIQLTFASAMNEASATDVTNYSIKKAGLAAIPFTATGTAATNADAELSADGKTVTITLETPLNTTGVGNWAIAEGDVFNLEHKALKSADGQELAKGTATVKYSDKVAPEFVSASASAKASTNKVTLTFSEPVDFGQATVTVDGNVVSVSQGSQPNQLVLTTGSNLDVNKTYNVSLLNIKDIAGNLMATNPFATTVTVASDTNAPSVSDIKVVRDNLLEVTFDKAMNTSTISKTSVKVLDVNLASSGITQGAVTAKPNTGNKTFLVPVSTLPFNNGTFNGVISVANTVKDAAGNASTAYTKNISITEDKTAPQVVSSTYKKVATYNGITTTNGAIVVKFNENVTASAAASAYTVIDNKTGATIADPTAATVNPNDNTELVLPLGAAITSGSTTYSIVMPTSAVVDQSLATNASAAANFTVDVSAGAPTAADVTAPTITTPVTDVVETAATSLTSGTTIVVNYTETGSGMDVASTTNANNYRLDGAALPAGSYVTLAGTTATIHIPAGTISKEKSYAFNINGVKDKAGNTMTPYVDSVTLTDDVRPELTTSTLNSNGTLSLGFSENVITGVGTEADFELKVNDSAVFNTGANKAFTIADGVGSDDGKYVITVMKSTESIQAASNTLTINGATYTTVGATDPVKFEFVDVNGSQSYDAGDILIKATVPTVAGGAAVAFAADGNYNLNNAASIKLSTKAIPTLVKDESSIAGGNVIKGSKTITVK